MQETDERISFLNIINELECQREGLIAITGSRDDFAALTPARQKRDDLKKFGRPAPESEPIVDTINKILLDAPEEDDDEEEIDLGGMGIGTQRKK